MSSYCLSEVNDDEDENWDHQKDPIHVYDDPSYIDAMIHIEWLESGSIWP